MTVALAGVESCNTFDPPPKRDQGDPGSPTVSDFGSGSVRPVTSPPIVSTLGVSPVTLIPGQTTGSGSSNSIASTGTPASATDSGSPSNDASVTSTAVSSSEGGNGTGAQGSSSPHTDTRDPSSETLETTQPDASATIRDGGADASVDGGEGPRADASVVDAASDGD
jgi:hypothetical protein